MTRILAITLALAASATSAVADGASHLKPEAQKHLDGALQAYKVKDWPVAIREFEQAYAIDPDTNLLYAIAQAYRFDNDCAKALDYYRRYRESRQCSAAPDRSVCEAQIQAADSGVALCKDAAPATPPAPPPGPPPQQPLAAAPATTSAPPAATITSDAADGSPWYASTGGDALTAGGVVGIGVGVGFLAKASSSESAAKSAMLRGDFLRDLDDATSQRRIGAIALGAGVALAAAGIYLYVRHGHEHGHGAMIATDGHTVAVAGSF
jgi:hypothetical protein|nr:hypothetical protein [Kofleriaceae bacterium]